MFFDSNGTLLDKGTVVLGTDVVVQRTGLTVLLNGEVTVDPGAGITVPGHHEITELVTEIGVFHEELTVPGTKVIIPATLDTLLDMVSTLVIAVGTEIVAFDTCVDTEVTALDTEVKGLDNEAAIPDTEITELSIAFSVTDRVAGMPATEAVILGRVLGNTVADSLDIVVTVFVTELESNIITVDGVSAKQLDTEVTVLCTAVKMVDIDASEDREITAITAKSPRCSKGINRSN